MTNLQRKFKRLFYIEQLKGLRVTEVKGVPVDKLTDDELKYELTMARIREGA